MYSRRKSALKQTLCKVGGFGSSDARVNLMNLTVPSSKVKKKQVIKETLEESDLLLEELQLHYFNYASKKHFEFYITHFGSRKTPQISTF